jgi:hypothetical protein
LHTVLKKPTRSGCALVPSCELRSRISKMTCSVLERLESTAEPDQRAWTTLRVRS